MIQDKSLFVVFNIGCIECGVSSQLVGVFETEAEAQAIADEFNDKFNWREGGQNRFQVFPLPTQVGVVHEEYRDGKATS